MSKDLEIKRIRLATCVETIIAVHSNLDPEQLEHKAWGKFIKLKAALESIRLEELTDIEIERVEEATNQVLGELGHIYSDTSDSLDDLGTHH